MATPQLIAIRDQAQQLHRQGRLSEALALHAEALRLAPDALGICMSGGNLAYSLGRVEESLGYFERAAQIDARCFPAIDAARRICVGYGLYERAMRYSQLSHALQPDPQTLMAAKLLIPPIAASRADIELSRQRYARGLEDLAAMSLRLPAPDGVLGSSAFFLAYHGLNDRELQVQAARLFARTFPSLTVTARHCQSRTRRPGRIRVGFISRFFYSHSICTTSRGLIAQLSRDRFEAHALKIGPSIDDAATADLRAAAEHFVALDPDLVKARQQIAALELDMLFFQDIGMEATSYCLGFARLAPVQCVSFGHPNTTGLPQIDYFVSNDLYETPGAASHYSESLFLLRNLPTLAYYRRPADPPPTTRAQLGLPLCGRLYVCPQTLYKVHPDFDELARQILLRDPDGTLVLIEGQFAEFTELLRRRQTAALGPQQARVCYLPRMDFPRFLQLLALADVVLDTPHFNGMNSSLEAFAMGTPVVTLPGELQRGRHTQAMYRKMGITAGIASDADEYVTRAIEVAQRRDGGALRASIRSCAHRLYEDRTVVEEFERFFVEALSEAGVDAVMR